MAQLLNRPSISDQEHPHNSYHKPASMRSINTIVLGAVVLLTQQAAATHGCSKTSDGWGIVSQSDVASLINWLRSGPDNSFYVERGDTYAQDYGNVQVCGSANTPPGYGRVLELKLACPTSRFASRTSKGRPTTFKIVRSRTALPMSTMTAA